jgi:hypothetical protein
MLKGLLILKINPPPPEDAADKKGKKGHDQGKIWDIVAHNVPIIEEMPQDEILEEISLRFQASPETANLNYRHFPYKYYVVPLTPSDQDPRYFCLYILDSTESLDIVLVGDKDTRQKLSDALGAPKNLPTILSEIFSSKNQILDKLDKQDVLQAEIGASANKLIDEGKFEAAQERIKLAKEIPPKLVGAFKRALNMIREKDFRRAERDLQDCLEFSQKIGDGVLYHYLSLKIQNTQQIPAFQKEVKSIYSSFTRDLTKSLSIVPYSEQIGRLNRAVELLDKLELDSQIERISELQTLIEKANRVSAQLYDLDKQIKNIANEFKER